MTQYEYKVVPAPAKGRKAPGVKGAEARVAFVIEEQLNTLAADGWVYLRADLLPSEERQGLTSSQTVYRSILIFQRPVPDDPSTPTGPETQAADTPVAAPPEDAADPASDHDASDPAAETPEPAPAPDPETQAEPPAGKDEDPDLTPHPTRQE